MIVYFGFTLCYPNIIMFKFVHSFIHYTVCLVTISKEVYHRVKPRAYSFKFQYLPFSSMSSSSCLCFLPFLPNRSIFSSIMCFRRQFLPKMWPNDFAFLCFIVRRIFLSSLALCHTSSFFTRSVCSQFFSSTTLQKFKVFLIYFQNVALY